MTDLTLYQQNYNRVEELWERTCLGVKVRSRICQRRLRIHPTRDGIYCNLYKEAHKYYNLLTYLKNNKTRLEIEEAKDDVLANAYDMISKIYPSLDPHVHRLSATVTLKDIFPVIVVNKSDLEKCDNVSDIKANPQRWQTQIFVNDEPKGIAVFGVSDKDVSDVSIKQVLCSDIAKEIYDAIDIVGNPEIKYILEIPSYFTVCVLFRDKVVIVRKGLNVKNLKRLTVYDFDEFRNLFKLNEAAVGVIYDKE